MPPSTTFRCQIHGLPSGPNDRHHWAAKKRINDACADQVLWSLKAWPERPSAPYARARVTITWLRGSGREMDQDNAMARAKCLIDAVVRGGLVIDDRGCYLDVVIQQETKRGRKHDAELTVEPLEN